MNNDLVGKNGRIIGTIRTMARKEFVYDSKHPNVELGYFDSDKNKTYDSYGREIASGRQLEVLPYLPHRIIFPLDAKGSREFTYHVLRNGSSVGPHYWDDGVCKGCGKRGNTCVEQGLPNLCEGCYRLLRMYSQSDSYGLERMSQRKPIDERTLRNVLQSLIQSANAVSKTIDTATKAAVIAGIKDCVKDCMEKKAEGNSQTRSNGVGKRRKKDETIRKPVSEICYYKPYDKEAYTEYLKSICQHAGSTHILNEYLKLSNYVRDKFPELSVNVKRYEQRLYMYLYYEKSDLRTLYKMLREVLAVLKEDFPWITDDAGFVDPKRKNMFVVIHYFIRESRP